jgi:hypothetical protein
MAAAPPPRPAIVSAANLLLLVAAAGIGTDSVIGLVHAEAVTAAFTRAYAGVEGVRFTVLSIQYAGVVLLVVAAGLTVLAVFNHRGSGTARINTWILGAIVLCWGGSSRFSERRAPRRVPDPAELERLLAEAVPGWVEPVTRVTISISMLALLAAMVLLALPPAHRFFRTAAAARPVP